jgi:hypothetical protein
MSEPSPSPSRRRWLLPAVAAVAVLIMPGAATWVVLTDRALSAIEVLPQSLRCDGKDVPVTLPVDEDTLDDAAPRPTYETRIDVDSECWLTVTVANSGSRTVELESMTFPAMAPGRAHGVLLETTMDEVMAPPHDLDQDGLGHGDAAFTVDQTLEAGAWTSLQYRIGYRADGATCTGVTEYLSDLPVAHVRFAGRSADVVGSVSIVHPSVKTTGNRNCHLDQ